MKDSFADLIRTSTLNALADPKNALLNFIEDIKEVKGFIKKYWLIPGDGKKRITLRQIKAAVSKIPIEAKKNKDAMENGRSFTIEKITWFYILTFVFIFEIFRKRYDK